MATGEILGVVKNVNIGQEELIFGVRYKNYDLLDNNLDETIMIRRDAMETQESVQNTLLGIMTERLNELKRKLEVGPLIIAWVETKPTVKVEVV